MELNKAKKQAVFFLEDTFDLAGLEDFYERNSHTSYRRFKEIFLEEYGGDFLGKLNNDMRVSLIVIGMFKSVMDAADVGEICRRIEENAGAMGDRFRHQTNGFYDLIDIFRGDGEPVTGFVAEPEQDNQANNNEQSYFVQKKIPVNLEADQTKSIDDSFRSIGILCKETYLSETNPEPYSRRPEQP